MAGAAPGEERTGHSRRRGWKERKGPCAASEPTGEWLEQKRGMRAFVFLNMLDIVEDGQ